MDATFTFEIPGQPVPQPRARMTRSGHAYTPDNGIRAYKAATVLAAKLVAQAKIPSASAHAVEMTFVIDRPPSHLRRDGGLTKAAPAFPPKRCGDWDNLAKGVCDAITDSGVVWLDDDQVVEALIRRRYAAAGEQARTVVAIRRLDNAAPP
jgi:Holliday junction resolvase RusA-like endonuclease